MQSKADIWMPLYIGDYLADTSHLDAERHGCYLLWMMHYWRKGPLPDSVPDLVRIGKLASSNASSIAQALLDEFFTMNGDGHWHQKRQDVEREKWQKKKVGAVEKAKKAAAGRWNDASSIPQAMLQPCPLPLPLSLPIEVQEQKPSPKPRKRASEGAKKRESSPRHKSLKAVIESYWNSKNTIPMPWDGSEGAQLGMWESANPTVTAEQFTGFLRNRFKSEVNHSERPSKWIRNVTSYANGPLNQFNKPLTNGTGKHSPLEGMKFANAGQQ